MIPFLNMRIYRSFSKNLTGFVEKMKQGELKVEDILDEDEIVQDVKSNPSTELIPFFNNEIIKKLIDFSTKMPNVPTDDKQKVDKKIGFKFPFNATEILCSDNAAIMDLFVKSNDENQNKNDAESNEKNSKENQDKKEEENKKIENEKLNEDENEKLKNEQENQEKKEEEINTKTGDSLKEEEKKEEQEKEKKDETKNENPEEKKDEKDKVEEPEKKKEEEKVEESEKKEKEEKKEENSDEKKIPEEEDKEKDEEILPAEVDTVNQEKEEGNNSNDSKPVLEYFFDFLANTPNTESEEIYVLTGYFQRILNHLITSKGNIVIPFIFDSPQNIPDNLIKHLNKKSIAEIINKILTYNDESLKDLNEKKKLFVTKILQDLNETNNELQFECISSLLISCLDKKEFFNLFMSENSLLELLYSSISKCEGKKLRNLINILIKINENILSNFDKPVTPNLVPENPMDLLNMIKNYGLENSNEEENQAPLNNEENLKSYLSFLFNVLKENSFSFLNDLNEFEEDSQMETTYQRKQKKLGLKKLSQIEFFRSIIDICVNSYAKKYFPENVEEIIKLADEKNVFWILNEIFLNFEFNNIFQTYYQQLFTIILNQESPEILINSVFENTKENKKLIPQLTEHLLNHMNFKYNNNENEVESGFFPTEVQILDNISSSRNIFVKKFIENEEDYKVFNECFSSDINSIFKQKLYFNPENDISNPLSNEPEPEPFIPNKALSEIIKEDLDIYNEYKNGGDYKKLLEEKKEREKTEREKFNKENQNNSQEIVNDNEDNQDTDVFETNDDDDLKKDKIYGNDGINFDNGWTGDDKIITDDELEDLMKELDL